ncbi:MAG: tryptophan 2,3-dioxygenase family protein [Gemmatimonadota bacterium]
MRQSTISDSFYHFLGHRGVAVPAALLTRDVTQPVEPNTALQEELHRVYQAQPDLVILLELMTDFDEGLQEWRYRHVKLAERTIGAKKGTGGSAGVEFLKQSLFKPIFPDLWAIRHLM